MRLSIYVRFTLKDRPPGFRGIYSDDYTLAKDRPGSFSSMVLFLIGKILEWYCVYEDADTLNQELDKIREALVTVTVEETDSKEDLCLGS